MAQALIDNAGPASLLDVGAPRAKKRNDGQDRGPTSTTLVIENMHCGGCLKKVETALASVKGVSNARANLSTHRATVTHAGEAADVSVLVEALQRAGFKAAELIGTENSDLAAADRDYIKRLAVAGFAAANIMLLSVSVWSGSDGDMPASLKSLFHWLSALIALPATVYAGQPFFRSAMTALKARRVNMDVPISLGVTLATGMSVYQTIRGSEQVYFDAAVTLLFFLLIGRALDMRMRVRSAGAAANLLGLRAHSALVLAADGTTSRMAARLLEPGMHVVTATGERFAADGKILSGTTEIDESLISGETKPRVAKAGDNVFAGTLNLGRSVTVETTAADERTLIAEIARLMQAAEQGRASYVRLADRAARLYAPAVHALGLATFLGWLALGSGWEPALTAAIAVLIITCPCALALAVPAVQVAATSRLFSKGVLVKAPDALERLAEVDTIVLDKTGTLTRGEPVLANEDRLDDATLARAAALAVSSRHPYARAVVRAAVERGIAVSPATEVAETSGLGLSRHSGAGEERLGSARWCDVEDGGDFSLWYRCGAGSAVPFEMTDSPRADAAAVIAALKSAGFSIEILSGDQPGEVERIATLVGITSYAAGLMPAEKLARLSQLKAEGRKPLMIGDGLNDAPSLAAAHASLSPSSAADISQTAADAVFQGELMTPVLETIAVARSSRRMALENFAIALGYNVIFVPLAVAGIVTPLIAAIAMSGSSIAVTVNALRLRGRALRLGTWKSGQ